MAPRNCIICGYYSNRPFCPSCEDKAYAYFDKVCQFLQITPRPTVLEVYSETFIPLKIIYGLKDMGLVDIIPSDGQVILRNGLCGYRAPGRDGL